MKTRKLAAILLVLTFPLVSLGGTNVEPHELPPADPSIEGYVAGIELCPKFICGNALFTGFYRGEVGGQRAFGTWFAAVDHEPLPTSGSVPINGGKWTLQTWVFSGFSIARLSFSGDFGEGTLTAEGGNFYRALVPMAVTSGGTGGIHLNLLLNENSFPPPVSGMLTLPGSE
jgi:hypothetical protein